MSIRFHWWNFKENCLKDTILPEQREMTWLTGG